MKYNIIIESTDSLTDVTKQVIQNFNIMTDMQFFCKYYCSKKTYLKRVLKYGDPYMKAPLAKFGKFLLHFKK